jgi:urease accessory protein
MHSAAIRALLTATLALVPTFASAHTGVSEAHDALHGFVHPIGGLDHVLAMVAVGIFATQLGGRALWLLPASFLAAMVAGGALAMTGISLPLVETAIALSVMALGAVICLNVAVPVAGAVALVAGAALFHGYAHGAEMPAAMSGIAYGLGFVAATALLHMAGIAIGLAVNHIGATASSKIVRGAGGAIALAGAAILVGFLL